MLLLLWFHHAQAETSDRDQRAKAAVLCCRGTSSSVIVPPLWIHKDKFISMLSPLPCSYWLLHHVVLVKPLRPCQRAAPLPMGTRAGGHRDLDQARIHCLCFPFLSAAAAATDSDRHHSLLPTSDFEPLLGLLVWSRTQTTGGDRKSTQKSMKLLGSMCH